jgi:hypothetical protein
MALGVAIVIGIIVLGVLLVLARGRLGASAGRHKSGPEPHIENLRYLVPLGQDAAVLIAALKKDGYVAVGDLAEGREYIEVACPAGRDRERARVRAIIADTHRTSLEIGRNEFDPGRVVFEDENSESAGGQA